MNSAPFSNASTGLWTITFGIPGIVCVTMSSRLGLTAEVIATESPSQERPVVIQITWASTASVVLALVRGMNSVAAIVGTSFDLFSSSSQQILGSGSPASRSITRLPPKAVSTSTIPGGSVLTSPISAAPSQPGARAQRRERGVGGLGRDEGDEAALVGDVHRVDPEDLRRARRRRADRHVALASDDRHPRGAGELVEHGRDPAAGRVAHAAQALRRRRSSSASAAGQSGWVSDSISASSSNSSRASMIAVPCSPIGPETSTLSPGRSAAGESVGARVDPPDAGGA